VNRFFYDVPPHLRSNFILFFWDISVWGLYTGSTVVFLTVYAARAGATSEQLGWMSAGPAIVALLASIPVGLLARRYPPKRSVAISALVTRTLLLAYVFIPTLVPAADRVNVMIVVTILMAIPNTFLNICFGPFFMLGIPPEWRGTVVGVRNALMSIMSFFVTLTCGQLLLHLDTPIGYQVVFFIGFAGAIATVPALLRIKQYPAPVSPPVHIPLHVSDVKRPLWNGLIPSRDPAGRHYLVVLVMLFAMNAVAFMGAPLMPLFTVKYLGLDDAVISIGSAATSILVFGVSLFVGRMARRYGNRTLTAYGVGLLCFQTVSLAFARDAGLYLVAAVIGGFASGILMAAQYNYHLDSVPRNDQTVWISWNSALGNIAALLGSVAGPALAGVIGIPATFITLGVLRLLIGAAVYLWG
jgi:MFS family permease